MSDAIEETVAPSADNLGEVAQGDRPGEKAAETVAKAEFDKLAQRYEESGKEAKRLAERLDQIERDRASSLKQQQQPPGFPSEDQVVSHLTEKLGFTADQARHQYQVERFHYDRMNAMETAMQAMQNQIKFASEQNGRLLVDSNPMAKEATDFCEAIPALKDLPMTEKIEQYKAYKERLGSVQKDLSAIKRAAGGAAGSGVSGGGRNSAGPSVADQVAKEAGFVNAAHMRDVQNASTQAEYDAIKTKYAKR